MNLYSIYDSKAELYLKIFPMQNDVTAIRAVTATILENKELCNYPADYELKSIGSWNETTGVITPLQKPLDEFIRFSGLFLK